MISVKNVKKSFGGEENRQEVLKGVSFDVNDGEFVVILGASGCGKSTLLNILSGLERPDEGSVDYDGVPITALKDKELTEFRRKNIGFIFQQYYLLPDMTVDKNVRMGADLAGNENYKEIITALGLIEKLKKYPRELSGGEQQRTAVARALAKNPRVLFADEPTGALDEKTGRELLAYLIKLNDETNFTLVMVTHNRNIAETADTVIEMKDGAVGGVIRNAKRKSAAEIEW